MLWELLSNTGSMITTSHKSYGLTRVVYSANHIKGHIRAFKIPVSAENPNANLSFYVLTSSLCVEILLRSSRYLFDRYILYAEYLEI